MTDSGNSAIRAVGAGSTEDWQLHPERHASLITDEAGPLKRILQSQALRESIERYSAADAAARRAQAIYKTMTSSAGLASFFAVCMAAAVLFWRGPGEPLSYGSVDVSILQGACIAISLVLSLIATQSGLFQTWMEKRAEAEHHRFKLFERVLAATEPTGPGELPLLPLQLEYFRRFQLDVQNSYYSGRGRQHARQAFYATCLRIGALLLILLAALPVILKMIGMEWQTIARLESLGWLPGGESIEQRTFLAFGTIGAALQGLLAARLLMNQDERNAVRYRVTAANLQALASRPLDEARNAAARGSKEDVLAFVALINDQISSEHREWINLRSIAPSLSMRSLKRSALAGRKA